MLALCGQQRPSLASFIRKTFKILNTAEYSNIISWDEDGKSIRIFDFDSLEDKVLETEFRHRNCHSFIRQLNMYGFKKMRKSTTTICYFFHPLFTRDGEQNLHLIKRKKELKKNFSSDDEEEFRDRVEQNKRNLQLQRLKSSKRKTVLRMLGIKRFRSATLPWKEDEKQKDEEDDESPSSSSKNQLSDFIQDQVDQARRTSINIPTASSDQKYIKFEESFRENRNMRDESITFTEKQHHFNLANTTTSFSPRNSLQAPPENLLVSSARPIKVQQTQLPNPSSAFSLYSKQQVSRLLPDYSIFPNAIGIQNYVPQQLVSFPFNHYPEMSYQPLFQYPCTYPVPQYPAQPVYFPQCQSYFQMFR